LAGRICLIAHEPSRNQSQLFARRLYTNKKPLCNISQQLLKVLRHPNTCGKSVDGRSAHLWTTQLSIEHWCRALAELGDGGALLEAATRAFRKSSCDLIPSREGLAQTETRLNGVLYLMKREAEFTPPTGRFVVARVSVPRGKYHDRCGSPFVPIGRRTTSRTARRGNYVHHAWVSVPIVQGF
jgi:hypothetical protein